MIIDILPCFLKFFHVTFVLVNSLFQFVVFFGHNQFIFYTNHFIITSFCYFQLIHFIDLTLAERSPLTLPAIEIYIQIIDIFSYLGYLRDYYCYISDCDFIWCVIFATTIHQYMRLCLSHPNDFLSFLSHNSRYDGDWFSHIFLSLV